MFDGGAATVATDGAQTIVAGAFFRGARPLTGPFPVSARSGRPLAEQAAFVASDGIFTRRAAATADGAGGWYVAFDGRVVRLDRDYELDPSFDPVQLTRMGSEGWVTELLLTPDRSRLYIAGRFEEIDGCTQWDLAAVDAVTGALSDWKPQHGSGAGGMVLSPDGSKLYVGGSFSAGDNSPPRALIALDTISGAVLQRAAPGYGGPVALSSDGATLYLSAAHRVDALDTATLAPRWSVAATPSLQNEFAVSSLIPRDDGVLVAGPGVELAGEPFDRPVLLRASDGGRLPWTTAGDARSARMSPDGRRLWLTPRSQGAQAAVPVDPQDGTPLPGSVMTGGESGGLLAVSADGEQLLLEGSVLGIESRPRSSAASIGRDGELLAWSPPDLSVPGSGENIITDSAVAADGTTYLVGGVSQSWSTASAVRAIAPDGTLLWEHHLPATRTLALSPDGSKLAVAGGFDEIAGVPRGRLAVLRTSDGAVMDVRADVVGSVYALEYAPDGATLYLGGRFSSVAGIGRANIAAISGADGSLRPFAPEADGSVTDVAVTPDGATVFAGGEFGFGEHAPGSSSIGGAERLGLAKLRASDGTRPRGARTRTSTRSSRRSW